MAELVATRGTCLRRKVGAVTVNHRGHVLSTGRNGVPSGVPHCNDGHPCQGAGSSSGTDLHLCLAVHAEINALSQCRDVWEIDTVYVTASPCFDCTKALLTSGCKRIVFLAVYPHPAAEKLWKSTGREWVRVSSPQLNEERGAFW